MKIKINKWITIFVLFIIAYMICALCYSNPISKMGISTDSSVFMYIADRMNSGELPYKDYFDHKGPILYIINWIGINLNCIGINGIWIIEYICIFLTILFTQKILIKVFNFNNLEASILNCLINMNIIFFLEGGNLTELYALPVITIALYLILTMDIKKIKTSNFLIGILLGIILCLRANMIALWITYYILVLIKCIKDKKIKELLNIVIFSFLGVSLVIGITVIFLIIKGILIDCIQDYLLFNFKYAIHSRNNIFKILLDFILHSNIFLYIIILISSLSLIKTNKFKIFNIMYMIITWLIVIQPRNPYLHYGLILIPTFIIPLSNIYTYIKQKIKNKYMKLYLTIILMFVILLIPMNFYIEEYNEINIYNIKDNEKAELATYISENSNDSDKILVIGNDCEIYLLSNRVAASKYLYQCPIYSTNINVLLQTFEDIKNNKPMYIIVLKYQTGEVLYHETIKQINEDYILDKEFNSCKVYKRKV